MWQSSSKRFNISGNDPIKDIILMVNVFNENFKIIKKINKKTTLHNKNLAKISLALDVIWHFKPHPITMYDDLEL
jgi:hypothetical protein